MQMDKVACKYHPDAALIEDDHAGDTICPECGLVVGDRVIDVSAEWRTFSNDTRENPSRVGGPENLLLGGSDLSTIIGPARGEASYNEFGLPKYFNRQTMSSSDQTLLRAFAEIGNMAERINVPTSVVDKANFIFKQVHEGGQMKRRSTHLIATACLYTACRKEAVPRSFKEICAVSNVGKTEIGRCFKLISKIVGDVGVIESEDFMSRFCCKLAMSKVIQRVAIHIARKATDMDIVGGKCPISVAAAAIYMASQASDDKLKQKEIGEICGVNVATIKNTYKLILPHAEDLFPTNYKFSVTLDKLPKS